ncbi:MAG: division/cell wall cluster transcriptional repressor MraZ [Clostridia bacterium]
MFYGEYLHRVDEKGRVIVPLQFREELGYKFIVTKGFDKCLFVYAQPEWEKIKAKLDSVPFTGTDVNKFTRFFFSGARECEIDKQGRALIPANLREYAGISKEAYLLGVSSKAEIWDKETWEQYNSKENMSPEMIAEKMAQLGI